MTSTLIDGELIDGMPRITFGAAIYDADGTLYVAGNGGDHDMNDATQEAGRSEEHTSELQSRSELVCRLLLEKKKKNTSPAIFTGY